MADTTFQQLQGFNPDLQDITRQRELAKALIQQGMNGSLQGQMIGNRYVGASPLEGVANLYSAYKGKQLAKEADTKEAQLADALRQQTVADIQAYGKAVKGQEATPAEYAPIGSDWESPTITKEAQPAVAPDYEKGLGILMGSKSPQSQALAQALLQDQLKTHILPAEGTLVRGSLGGVGGQTVSGAPKEPTEYKEYLKAQQGGYPGSFFQYQQDLKRAGAPSVSVSTGKDLASQVGDIAKESRIGAVGAVQQADAANRIIQSIDSNKIFSGPGANAKLNAAQLGQVLGTGGKDQAETIANTRQALQGLAQLTLQGRKQMRGEGSITESEGALANRAMSGDISLTGAEIRQLAEAAKRSAKFTYGMHQNLINTMGQSPDQKGLIPYYQVPANANIFEPTPVGGVSNVRSQADKILEGR